MATIHDITAYRKATAPRFYAIYDDLCGIANATLANSAAYLQGWMQVLRHDPTLLVHAAAQAQRAADYIQNLHPDTGAVHEDDDRMPGRLVPTA